MSEVLAAVQSAPVEIWPLLAFAFGLFLFGVTRYRMPERRHFGAINMAFGVMIGALCVYAIIALAKLPQAAS